MPVTREARYLSANDIGKHIKGEGFEGTLDFLYAGKRTIMLEVLPNTHVIYLNYDSPVTLTGQSD